MSASQAALPAAPATIAPAAQAGPGKGFVEFADVEKSYDGRTFAVTRMNLTVARGEFLTLLGPSGSGKTTTLNMLAGFERPTHGTITLEGQPVDRLPPYQRNIGMVFQNYALFPHMTVEENVGFPLSVRQVGKADIASRVASALDMVRLRQFGDRRPTQLSGGQQQRVALARALVFKPSLVLMDEPLGALDKKLREHMQLEIKQIHTMLGVTIVYVTHDQSEALTMSDRVAVFNNGGIAQLGSPDDLYNNPQSSFVASFIGENNTLEGVVDRVSGAECRVRLSGGGELTALAIGVAQGAPCQVAIRPERLTLTPMAAGGNALPATVDGRIYLGDHLRLVARLANDQVLTVKVGPEATMANGEAVTVSCAPNDCHAFPADAGTGGAIPKQGKTT
ncbi:MAG: ABC transporter ATP-binding protein [Mesorhizobium sp.]|uniref:ABC transporter ATP-binding protein n=1 Tax=unclassified Mesorhizobium TaxID=325217 RepID=UPI000FCADEC8|nr:MULTISPECIES: ABC transporter ATP-binding protein [unclassified Mesorhizobium]RUX46841.1 ABC transporter ATP-binding protein [Mesorhizobium sp. M4A.F.Ca.ET.050.02.1.1]RVD40499.1 ABC transporter ATP-binding protein [Mesorhizobium sp. M4A.F.Ca.ET.020.02.1.1]RWC11680.1 MAG: ABC transporter ATP-binding protein [Mesorhizobium sp.]RWD00532.1 MAG: ABC transporter ATP-binding protein [Mesorhizobium sp.]RWD22810.1 MAG: ABC transporter ATP-binding protein [Mesorhizobium sp.]